MLDRNRHCGPILLDERKLTAQMHTHGQTSRERERASRLLNELLADFQERGGDKAGRVGANTKDWLVDAGA